MADIDSDSEIQFNPRSRVGEGDTVESDQRKDTSVSADDDDASSLDDSPCQSTPVPQLSTDRNKTSSYPSQDNQNGDRSEPTPSFKRGPNLKPDTYNGEGDWESYITHFELCAELGRWSQREVTLTLAASLRGQARVFYMNLMPRERSTYRELSAKLSQRFGSARQNLRWISRLESRSRQPGEGIATFGDDIIQLAQRAHSDLDPYAQEAIALNQLYKSVEPEIKYKCIAAGCTTVAHAVEIIDTYESVVNSSSDKKKSEVRMVSQSDDSEITKLIETIQNLNSRIYQLEQQMSYRYSKRQDEPRRCYTCQSPHHLMRSCPKNQSSQ